MDFSFIDCGSERNDWTKRADEAGRSYCCQFQSDIPGVRSFFFQSMQMFLEKVVYLIGSYQKRCCL